MTMPIPAFFIGSVPVFGDLVLSPMDGLSDLPFRLMCRQFGSALSYTEFINGLDVLRSKKLPDQAQRKIAFDPSERPVVFQLFDSEPNRLLKAALRLLVYQPDIIDVNMGCSARCVAGRGAGAGLLRSPEKIAQIFKMLSQALPLPVTGKIRLGWDEESRNYIEIARIIEQNGGAAIAIHARTKKQGYSGQADWDAIAEVKRAVSIPVIGNGDVRTVADIERIKAHTACDGVMIGRAAIGNPWIFSRLDRHMVDLDLVRSTMLGHLERMLSFYGPALGLLLFRKHASHYLAPYSLSLEQRKLLFAAVKREEFLSLVDSIMTQPI